MQLPRETECAEFKANNTAPESIGSNTSALANSSGLMKAPFGYIVWGVTDEEHEVVGTDFDPHAAKKGNEPLLSWLATQLRPSVDFRVHEVDLDGNHVVYMEIPAASHTPIRFQDLEHIRVGPTTRKLRDFPEKERALWATFGDVSFESQHAKFFDSASEAIAALDFEAYLMLTQTPPMRIEALSEQLAKEGFICPSDSGRCAVTNIGALLFAKNLDSFPLKSR